MNRLNTMHRLNRLNSPQEKAGVSWSADWTTLIKEGYSSLFWWHDNGVTATRTIRLCYKLTDTDKAIDFTIKKNTDDHYEINAIKYGSVVYSHPGIRPNASLASQAYNINGVNTNEVSFNGTDLIIRYSKLSNAGIMRAIRFNGIFRGYTTTNATGKTQLNNDKQEGYYYVLWETGDYSSIHASLSSITKGDIIQWSGGSWHIYHEADYSFTEIDTYSAVYAEGVDTFFSDLPLGNHRVGVMATGTKNPASSALSIYLKFTDLLSNQPFVASGGSSMNYFVSSFDFTTVPSHFEMSTSIIKTGSAQSYQWIPAHSSVNTLHSGVMENWIDGVLKEGNCVGDVGFQAVSTYRLQNVMYAINTGSAGEDLLKVTYELVATIDGIAINVTYETLIATTFQSSYSYMLPYKLSLFNKIVTDLKEELTLPANGAGQLNITDGANRKLLFVYNNTDGGAYEDLIFSIEIPDPAKTNDNTGDDFGMITYAANDGKLYASAHTNYASIIGKVRSTSIVLRVGIVNDLINKVAARLV